MSIQIIPNTRWSYGSIKKIGKSPYNIEVGDFVSIGSGVKWISVGHNTDWITTYPFSVIFPQVKHITGHPKNYGPLIIDNDVWIGNNVTFIGRVRINSGAVIAANSVVKGIIPHYSIIYGNPAEFIKYRFTKNQIEALLTIKWWEWSDEKIIENIDLMCSDRIDEFIEKHRGK